ncbi:white-collar 2 [Purpureocillium lavendulum]|uniref:White-collar 2 n=1 Tax=Purpureocillium lavendulum TaxID=1247861 RepID=A0AB34FU17_9HYPO|nr:white-collar 2 [Purpureocillium lavendulum]
MSQSQPPPQGSSGADSNSNFFGFPNFDFPHQGAAGHDFAGFFDGNMLGSFDDVHMMDTADDAGAAEYGSNSEPANQHGATDESIARAENQFNTAANNVPGAGPLPPGSFAQMSLSSGNTLTEFTKRRNWPAKVVEELKDFLHILDAHGRVKYASPSVLAVAGYNPEEVSEVFLKDLIHPDDQGIFVSELNESIASGNPLRMFYRFRKKDGTYAIFEAVGHAHIASAKFAPNPNNQTPFCQAVFMMARPYPTKNAGLLDSFLEHKIENERLRRRIAELRREEEADADEAQRQWVQSQEGRSDITPSEDTGASSVTPFYRGGAGDSMSQSDRNALNAALTRENLEGASVGSRPDSLRDKMARYEGSSHADTIEMLTGLRYHEGERSRGITTGNASPTLIKGDAGIAIPVDRDSRPGEKKKKLKTTEEYVCTDCGTLDSPEWRKGPSGPKTLCNACGLRWAKKEKKRNTTNNPSQQGQTADPSMG